MMRPVALRLPGLPIPQGRTEQCRPPAKRHYTPLRTLRWV